MTRYVALMDRAEGGSYGLVIPDLSGCNAMGDTVEEAMANLTDTMSDWTAAMESLGQSVAAPRAVADVLADPEVAEAIRDGAVAMMVPLVRKSGRMVKANLSIDSGVLAAIDAAAEAQHVTRSAMVELLARRTLAELA